MLTEAIIKLSGGNPGAAVAMCEVVEISTTTQLDDFLNSLEKYDIKGSHIWVCYSDLCDKNVDLFLRGVLDGSLKTKLIETDYYKYYLETNKR